jgi:hypothetical protein
MKTINKNGEMDLKKFRKEYKRELTPEEIFNLKLERFLKDSKERQREAGHKRHTKGEVKELKNKINNKHKNFNGGN